MRKSLEIKAKFNTQDFDRSIDQMQRKLRDLYAPNDMMRMQSQMASKIGGAGINVGMSGNPAGDAAVLRMRQDLNKFIKEEFQQQEKLVKMITIKDDFLKKELEKQKSVIKGTKEELDIKQRIATLEETQARRKEDYNRRNEALNQAVNIKQAMTSRDNAEFANAMGKFGKGGMSLGMGTGMLSALSAVGTAVGIGGTLYGNYSQSPLRTTGNLGGGVQSTIGQDANTIYGRRSAFESAFNPERSRAAQMALEASQGRRIQTGASIGGNILGLGAAGASAGAAATALGGPLTAAGGAVVGGIGGLATGAWRAFSDPAQRSLMMSGIPGSIGKRYGNEYESLMTKQMGGDYQKALQDLKNQNPGKTMASQYYEGNYMQNLQAQRQMGMGNDQFYGPGGFLQSGVGGGFTPEMMMQMSSGIIGAGGSTRSAVGNSLFGNQLSRGMDLTNSSQVLGTLSGGIGGAEATRTATVKVLAEGVRLGLDDSKFAEENRRFVQTAAEIVSRSGAGGEGDFGRVAGGFGRFMGENTVAGIGAAKTAYEQYQQISSSVTGPRGVMRAAGFMKDEKLNQLSTIEKQALMQLPEEQLNENNPLVSGLAEKLGISTQEMVSRVKSVNEGAVSRFKQADEIRDRLRARGVDVGKSGSKEYMATLSSQDRADVTSLMAYQTTELGNQGQREMINRATGTVGKPAEFGPGIAEGLVEGKLVTGKGRGEDVTVSETAKDFGIVLQNFRDFKKEIMPSADAIANFTGKIREMMLALSKASDTEIPNIIKYYTQDRAKTQTQGGKPSR